MQTPNTNLPINPETGTIYFRAQLREAFDAVQDSSNWKNPIDAAIPAYMKDVTEQAVIFFAGCRPTFTAVNPKARKSLRRLRCQAVGYYVAVGA
jgi:hypothetical protein